MNCLTCGKKLRADNTVQMCRKHRNFSTRRKNYIKNYVVKNEEKIKAYKKQYAKQNRKHSNAHQRKRFQSDIEFKLRHALRVRLNRILKGKNLGSAIKTLGCTAAELKNYLENLFQPGMSWDNWGRNGWHIDHKKPLSSFDLSDPEQFKAANHFSNLQPMWAVDNLKKGSRI